MAEPKRDIEPESPCISVCTPDPDSGYCMGCLRTLDEIARWPVMTADEKRALLEELDRRLREGT